MHFVQAKGILSQNNGMNIYRGCSHGCIYCDSRSKCYGFTHAFEDIEVKENAPELLEQALRSKRHKCMIGTGAMCDPYLPAEKELQLTRKCLELIDRYEYGVTVLTKSNLVLRDLDLLQSINRKAKAVLQMTLTTYDEELCRKLEPNVSTTRERFEVLMRCKELGIPTFVWMTPILPFINDTRANIEGLLDYCLQAGVQGILVFDVGVTLREGDREYFYQALDRDFPGIRQKYVSTYGNAYDIPSPHTKELMALIQNTCTANGMLCSPKECFTYLHEFPER
ncbi:SPL family radical SAM protein, partial [Simiaoa sp.]|uniref:SPL family radical SAM protein n=1 Tax=Simiaoa sp. TaxID=2944202 RepID=UPI003F80B469